ncbi:MULTISPECIES: DUF1659 domain-containing protein [Clostridium]|uniref:DUF1659 domain-containing protein n=2 Tax=Clostridium TaxID=1485 RepID=A0ABW8T660_9CLOT
MALQNTLAQSAVTIRYKNGIDSTGKDIIKTKKFSNVKVTATDQNVYDTAAALAGLMEYELNDILRSNDCFLING